MKLSTFLLAVVAFGSTCFAADVRVYFGTYTGPKSKGIYTSLLDTETGKLSAPELAGEATKPSFLALSPNGKYLYAALEGGGGAVGAFAVGANGKLTLLNTQSSGGAGACHVSVDATGKNVFVANYDAGSVACLRVKSDGSLEAASVIKHAGSGPNPQRQDKPYAHSMYPDPTNHRVYSCDLGTDDVFIYQFDAEKGALIPNDPKSGKVPPGGGPRHLSFHPNGKFVYVNNEMGLSVTVFAVDPKSGALTAIETVPTLPEGANPEGVSTAENFCHPNGKWLYVSNRAHNTIAVFSIADDGRIKLIENEPTPVVPRGFGISPDGKWIVVGGQKDDKVTVLKIDQTTGKLEGTGQSIEVGSPVCVIFAGAK